MNHKQKMIIATCEEISLLADYGEDYAPALERLRALVEEPGGSVFDSLALLTIGFFSGAAVGAAVAWGVL